MKAKDSFEQAIEIAERNKRAMDYIRRSQRKREMAEPKWFNYVLAFSAVGCGFIWANISAIL